MGAVPRDSRDSCAVCDCCNAALVDVTVSIVFYFVKLLLSVTETLDSRAVAESYNSIHVHKQYS